MKKNLFDPKKLLPEFDIFLHKKNVKFKATIIGSGAFQGVGL